MFKDRNHKSVLMRPLERMAGLPSPYGLAEGLGCLYRESHGPARGGPLVPYPPKRWTLNEGVAEEALIGFAGDILDTKGLPARVGADVQGFYAGCDAVIANFESTITDLPGHGTSVRHDRRIVDALADAFDPAKTYLSVANNHAGDYPKEILRSSIGLLAERGFTVFGLESRPFVDVQVGPPLRVVGVTDWSNASCESVAMLDAGTTPGLAKPGAFNLLFPHWGYELELNPRPAVMRKARAWLARGFDAIVAHHGHTPRALYAEPGAGREPGAGATLAAGAPAALVADSLGDFVCGFSQAWYRYGVVAKAGLGRDPGGRLAIGRVSWEFCETGPADGVVTTRLRPDLTPEGLAASLTRRA